MSGLRCHQVIQNKFIFFFFDRNVANLRALYFADNDFETIPLQICILHNLQIVTSLCIQRSNAWYKFKKFPFLSKALISRQQSYGNPERNRKLEKSKGITFAVKQSSSATPIHWYSNELILFN